VQDSIGVTVGAQVLAPGSLERSAGKLRRVIDKRSP
jgi:phenylacetate-CoA ligase